ncbi:alpha/beta hydrolase [Corynebacterium lizhenjunii]|uniref:Alpha/beta hydrolase n=1 Tax=Corynebacterium lizhenjunii TaxID=2709394 RepID=A0A7T0KEW0_9CORY|nr:alpha/beta hydrolase [Corynebacterium lizhenjunii]QPK79523.1 alpha/beta hydrolase [Corynebacterium lizhenjunii]
MTHLATYRAGDPSAPAVVLSHGVSDSALTWVDLIPVLAQDYYVIAVDHLGHGLSPRLDDTSAPFESALAAFLEVLDSVHAQQGRPATVLGHSMGGALAASASIARPELVRALVLEDPAFLDGPEKQGFIDRAPAQLDAIRDWVADPADGLARNAAARPTWTAQDHTGWITAKVCQDPGFIGTGIVTFAQPWEELVGQLDVPTLLLTSDTPDVLITPAKVAQIANPHVHVVTIPGATHALRRDQPEAFQRTVLPFLETHA